MAVAKGIVNKLEYNSIYKAEANANYTDCEKRVGHGRLNNVFVDISGP